MVVYRWRPHCGGPVMNHYYVITHRNYCSANKPRSACGRAAHTHTHTGARTHRACPAYRSQCLRNVIDVSLVRTRATTTAAASAGWRE